MGFGQAAARSWNKRHELTWGDPGYVDRLLAGRRTNAIVSSLTAPIVFLGARLFLGGVPALIGAVLLALDPQYAAVSRLAHIDGVLTLLVSVSFLLFLRAERNQSLKLKLAAGCFWGLAIATKPTAASLVFALVLYKVLRSTGLFSRDERTWKFLSWGDVLAVLAGHLVLCLIYTRFWHTNATYVWRLHIQSSLADFFLHTGQMLAENSWWFVITGWIALVGMHFAATASDEKSGSGLKFHLGMFAVIAGGLAFIWPIVPPVFENMTRYWTWAFGLSGEVHNAYGRVWEPPPLGYWGYIGRHLPSLPLLGLGAALIYLVRSIASRRCGEREKFVFACLLHAVVWALILGVSSKQTVRYIMPAWPTIYLAAAWGIYETWQVLIARVPRAARAGAAAVAVICAFQGLQTFYYAPHYELFHSALSGGIGRAVAAGERLPPIGQREAVEFLQAKAREKGADLYVMVLGDASVLEKTYRRTYPKDHKRLHFIAFGPIVNGDYIVVSPQYNSVLEGEQGAQLTPAYVHKEFGYSFVRVMETPYYDYSSPYVPDLSRAARQTGDLAKDGDEEKYTLIGKPGKHKKGLLLFREHVRVKPGRYKVSYSVSVPEGEEFDEAVRPDEPAVKLEVSTVCESVVRRRDLSRAKAYQAQVFCNVEHPSRLQFKIYWWAKTPVEVSAPSIVRD